MARYFFHIRQGARLIFDPEGVDLPNLAAALSEVEAAAREILADCVLYRRPIDQGVFEICRADGALLATFRMTDVLRGLTAP